MLHKNPYRKDALPAPAVSASPRDPNRTLRDMIDTIEKLRAVYEHETTALERMDTKSFVALQDNKIAFEKDYQTGVEYILRHKAEIRNADPALRGRLEDLQAGFSELSFKNMDALKRMQRVVNRLGNTVRKVAKDHAQKHQAVSYGANGAMNLNDKKRISMGISETA